MAFNLGDKRDVKTLKDRGEVARPVAGPRYQIDPDGYDEWWRLATSGQDPEKSPEPPPGLVPVPRVLLPPPPGVKRVFISSEKGLVETYSRNIRLPLYVRKPDGHLGAVEV